jgi:hypothetical protein
VFVEDGAFEILVAGASTPVLYLPSRRAIRDWAARRLRARAGRFSSRHYQSGTVFDELSPESARTRTMVLVTHQRHGEEEPRVAHTGVYHDRWRRTSDGWRLAHRAAHLDQEWVTNR